MRRFRRGGMQEKGQSVKSSRYGSLCRRGGFWLVGDAGSRAKDGKFIKPAAAHYLLSPIELPISVVCFPIRTLPWCCDLISMAKRVFLQKSQADCFTDLIFCKLAGLSLAMPPEESRITGSNQDSKSLQKISNLKSVKRPTPSNNYVNNNEIAALGSM